MIPFSLQVQPLGAPGQYVIQVTGALDMKTSQELELACQPLMQKGQGKMILDFSRLEYINSQGLGVLLQLQKQLGTRGGGVVVAGLSERVRGVFETTGVHKVIGVYATAEQARRNDPLFAKE